MTDVLITTDYACAEADAVLTAAGYRIRRGTELRGVTGAIVAHDRLTADVLARADRLRAIVRSGVGYDAIDVDAAARLGIQVSNLPGINSNAVAEYTIGLLLSAARGLVASAAGVAAGGWPRGSGQELRGATLGLVGYGLAARAVVPLASAFGMRILCSTRHPGESTVEFTDLPTLLRASDYVSLHTALTPATRHLVDAAALALMKPTAFLVNTARGGLVDEAALAHAVATGRLAGAALDVVTTEPLPAGSPLRGVDGITVFSHLAGQTAQARRATALAAAHELVAALRGAPRFSVNQPKEEQ